MAKPHADRPGNGMHVHLSVIDQRGQNIFDDGSEAGSQVMQHALAGLLAAMPESMLIPHTIIPIGALPLSHMRH